MSTTYQAKSLHGQILTDSVYLFGRITRAVLWIDFTTETNYVETCLLIKTRTSTICISVERQRDEYTVYINNRLEVLDSAVDVPSVMFPPLSGVQISDYTIPYARGGIDSKSYVYRSVPAKGYIPKVEGSTYRLIEVDTKYLEIEMSSSGTNARYGVKIENIPLFPSFIAFEHVHLSQSSVRSKITVKLFTDFTLY